MRRRGHSLLRPLPDRQLALGRCDIQFHGGRYAGPCRIVRDLGTMGVLIRFPWQGKTKQIMCNQKEVQCVG